MSKSQKITLNNGLRLVMAPKADSLTTTLLVLVEAGSKYETREINGISHFLEHLCFKGTKKRPKNIDIASELDSLGASYNAFTGMEYTGYFAKVLPKHTEKIMEIISDIYLNPVFNPEEINKERGVIIEEINMYEDLPMRRVQDIFTTLLYGDQPAGWDIIGKKEIIQKLTCEDFMKYRDSHYLAQSTVVVAAGAFEEEKIIELIENSFLPIKSGEKINKIKTTEYQVKPEVLLKHKKSDQTHLVVGVRAFDIFDSRRFTLYLLTDILGGGMSSRLFQKIRAEMGAAYYISAEADLFTDHGYLSVSAGVDHNKLETVLEVILEEFKKITKEISDKELQTAKDHLIGQLTLGLETSDGLANFYGGQEILKREIIELKELMGKIQAIKKEEIIAVGKEIFQNQKLNLALIGPFEDKGKFEKILGL